MHNDISNFLRIFISNMNEKRDKKIKQRNEIVVGPFVLVRKMKKEKKLRINII